MHLLRICSQRSTGSNVVILIYIHLSGSSVEKIDVETGQLLLAAKTKNCNNVATREPTTKKKHHTRLCMVETLSHFIFKVIVQATKI